jgi:hypothetical protein
MTTQKQKEKYVKFSNGTGTLASLVASVAYNEESFRVFLKNTEGTTLCSIRCENEEEAMVEIGLVNDQLGR